MENNLRNIRDQIKENSEELQDFIRDLGNWEKEIKRKDEELRSRPKESEKYSTETAISSSKIIQDGNEEKNGNDLQEKKEHKDEEEENEDDDEEEEEEANMLRLKQKALVEKDKGNRFFSEGKYDDAIACYTSGIQADPANAVLPANRAMAFIKKGQLAAAEQDCTLSISLDYSYAKAFFRRGTCRLALKKLQLARQDFLKVVEMEPSNKFARIELNKLEEIFRNRDEAAQQNNPADSTKSIKSGTPEGNDSEKDSTSHGAVLSTHREDKKVTETEQELTRREGGETRQQRNSVFSDLPDQVKPVYKAAHLRSKKPLERLTIDVRSSDEETEELTIPPPRQRPSTLLVSKTTGSSGMSSFQTPSTPSVTPSTPKALPPVPQTAFQFEMDWRKLRHWHTLRTQYLKTVTPESLKRMYKQSMETEIFIDIIHCLKDICQEDKEASFHYLKSLTQVGRFSTTVLFLDPNETQIIKNILDVIAPVIQPEELKCLRSQYAL